MATQVTLFANERDYIGLDVTITDNFGAKTRVTRDAIYNEGEDDLFVLMNEFKRVLVAAGYLSSSVNRIQYLDADEMEQAKAAGIVVGDIDD